ncbi:MAG: hypothetical protein EON57_11650, partial [Alphaproteobacteria bacterium]
MLSIEKCLIGISFLVAAGLSSASASAATVVATLQSVGTGDTITLHAIRPNGQTIAQQVLVGRSTFTRTGGTDTQTLVGSGVGNSFYAFCVEPFEDAALNANYSFTMSPLGSAANSSISGGIGAAKSLQISQLFGQFGSNLGASMTQVQASAFQVAVWEIVSELSTNPFNVLSGNTYFSTPASSDFGDVMNLAQSYLNYVGSANANSPQAQNLQALTINGNQDFLVQTVGITAPEPGTWMM